MKNLTKKYIFTYDRNDQIFNVHREGSVLPNIEFIIHDSGLHYYDTSKKDLAFLKTVYKNKEGFRKRQIKSVVIDWELQQTLGFTNSKEVKCTTISNHIQDCKVDNKYMDNAETIWGIDVPYLKGKTTRNKPIQVTEDIIIFPKEFLNSTNMYTDKQN